MKIISVQHSYKTYYIRYQDGQQTGMFSVPYYREPYETLAEDVFLWLMSKGLENLEGRFWSVIRQIRFHLKTQHDFRTVLRRLMRYEIAMRDTDFHHEALKRILKEDVKVYYREASHESQGTWHAFTEEHCCNFDKFSSIIKELRR